MLVTFNILRQPQKEIRDGLKVFGTLGLVRADVESKVQSVSSTDKTVEKFRWNKILKKKQVLVLLNLSTVKQTMMIFQQHQIIRTQI